MRSAPVAQLHQGYIRQPDKGSPPYRYGLERKPPHEPLTLSPGQEHPNRAICEYRRERNGLPLECRPG